MRRVLWAMVLAGCSRSPSTLGTEDSGATTTPIPISARADTSDAGSPSGGTICGTTVRAERGDSFEQIARRCYGSRTYQDCLIFHNHHERRLLRAGEALDTPPFEVLLNEQLPPKYKREIAGIQEAFSRFRSVQDEIEAQFRAGSGGSGPYHPSARAKEALTAAAHALRPVVTRLKSGGVRNQQFARALGHFEALSAGAGSFSFDYETEEVHQSFRYATPLGGDRRANARGDP